MAHFLLDCDALPNTREVTTRIPTHSTLHINVAHQAISQLTRVAAVFRRIREERLSSEEMRQVVFGGMAEKAGGEGNTRNPWPSLRGISCGCMSVLAGTL